MDKIFEMIGSLLEKIGLDPSLAQYVFYGAIGLVVLLVLIIVICCVSAGKKKKAKALKEEKSVEVEAKEEPKVEEVKEETVVVEKVEETPVVEEKIEETVVVEKVEETPTVEEKPVPVKKTRKAPTKKVAEVKVEETKTEEVEVEDVKPTSVKRTLGKFTISQDGPNFRYRLKASNGELLVVSELYTSEKACRTGIETIKKNAETAKVEIVEDKHGLFSFRIMTKQGRCLATSANYKTKARALSASESFKKFVVTERIELEEAADHFEVEEFTKEITPEEKGKYKVSAVNDGYIYQLVASNGRVIAKSQVYKSDASCKEGLEKFRVIAYEGTFFIFKDKNNKYQFKLYNKQKRLVLAGEVYDSKDRVYSVIESIKRFAKLAEVVEEKEVA